MRSNNTHQDPSTVNISHTECMQSAEKISDQTHTALQQHKTQDRHTVVQQYTAQDNHTDMQCTLIPSPIPSFCSLNLFNQTNFCLVMTSTVSVTISGVGFLQSRGCPCCPTNGTKAQKIHTLIMIIIIQYIYVMQHNISNAIHCYLHDIRAALAPALCKYSLCKYSLCKHSCHSLPTDFLTSSTPELNCHV